MRGLSTSSTSHGFPRFLKLPREIRQHIWKYAIAHPRLIQVQVTKRAYGGVHCIRFSYKGNEPPALLAVCTESRELAYPIYSNLKPRYIHRERDILGFVGWEELGIYALYELHLRPVDIARFIYNTCEAEAQGASWSQEKQKNKREWKQWEKPGDFVPTRKGDMRILITRAFGRVFKSIHGYQIRTHPNYSVILREERRRILIKSNAESEKRNSASGGGSMSRILQIRER